MMVNSECQLCDYVERLRGEADRERHGMSMRASGMSVSIMSCIHNDDFSYLKAKKVKVIEGEASLFLEIVFKAEEVSSNGGMVE